MDDDFLPEIGSRVFLKDEDVGAYVDDIKYMPEQNVLGYKVIDDWGREFVYFGAGDIAEESFDKKWLYTKDELGL